MEISHDLAEFFSSGKSELASLIKNPSSQNYMDILHDHSFPSNWAFHAENFILRQDNAFMHPLKGSAEWQRCMEILALEWLAHPLNLNLVENL